jgi:hypothetical protein
MSNILLLNCGLSPNLWCLWSSAVSSHPSPFPSLSSLLCCTVSRRSGEGDVVSADCQAPASLPLPRHPASPCAHESAPASLTRLPPSPALSALCPDEGGKARSSPVTAGHPWSFPCSLIILPRPSVPRVITVPAEAAHTSTTTATMSARWRPRHAPILDNAAPGLPSL